MALFDGYLSDDFAPPYGGDQIVPAPSFSGAQPPPKRLTYEEILAHLKKPDLPEAPDPYTSFGALPADQQKSGKLDALWAGLAALSGGMTSHQWGPAASEGTAAIQGIQERAVKQANAAQDSAYQTQLAAAQQKAEQERTQQQAAALTGMYNRATANEDPMSPFSQQAADAARAGDMSALEKMASPEVQSQRAAAKARGLNPDAWDTIQQLKAQLADNLKKQSLTTLAGPEADAAGLKAKAEEAAKLPGEQALKLSPSYQQPAQYEPLDRVAARTELVASIEDKHAALRAAAKQGTNIPGRLGQAPDGTWGWLSPPTAAGQAPAFTPIDGQPQKGGGLSHFQKDGVPYVWNPTKPELGAVEVPTHAAGEAGAPSFKDLLPQPSFSGVSSGASSSAGATAPPTGANPTQKLGALMADPAMAAKIKVARQKGISDAAIAAHLGL